MQSHLIFFQIRLAYRLACRSTRVWSSWRVSLDNFCCELAPYNEKFDLNTPEVTHVYIYKLKINEINVHFK